MNHGGEYCIPLQDDIGRQLQMKAEEEYYHKYPEDCPHNNCRNYEHEIYCYSCGKYIPKDKEGEKLAEERRKVLNPTPEELIEKFNKDLKEFEKYNEWHI